MPKKTLIVAVIIAVLAVAGTGGGVWYWQNQQIQKQKQDSDKKIQELEKQIEDLGKEDESESTEDSEDTDETANWKTYNNSKLGFSFKYPPDWKITDYMNNDNSVLYLNSPTLPGGNSKDYFQVEFRLTSKDDYALTGGSIVSDLGNNFSLYQKKEIYGGKDGVRSNLTDKDQRSLVTLPNGKKLLASIIYSATEGDLGQSSISYDGQLASTEYKEAINIFKSIAF